MSESPPSLNREKARRAAAPDPKRPGERCGAEPARWLPIVDRARCEGKRDCVEVCPYSVFEVRRIDDADYKALGLPSSELVAKRLGSIHRYLCVAPSYLARSGTPRTIAELRDHDAVELPGIEGRPRRWTFSKPTGESKTVDPSPRITVNDPLTIYRLVLNGAGIGGLSSYVCAADIEAGRLVRLFPEWEMPSIEVNVVFPSNRELSPTVRAFVDFLKNASGPSMSWRNDLVDNRA